MNKLIIGINDEDYPRTPQGDEITEQYWLGIESAINKCGDRFLELWRDYKHYPVMNHSKRNHCNTDFDICRLKFGEIPFAINVVIFYDNIQADAQKGVFHLNINSYYQTMPVNLFVTVERLRFINSKWIEKKNSIASQLRGANLGVTKT